MNKPPRITLGSGRGWSRHEVGNAVIHICGYVFDGPRTFVGLPAAEHAKRILIEAEDDANLKRALANLAGHFALVAELPGRLIATVDRARSIPLMFAHHDGVTHIDDQGRRLRDELGLSVDDVDMAQALACAMSGYSIGGATLYRGLRQLRAGEALVCDGGLPRLLRWFVYDAWKLEAQADPEKQLSDLHRFLMERMVASAEGRTIAVPLSAGLDSRFIASGLKAVGYRNVQLFSYGRPGNHEAETAKAIAERLGYPWTFVPFSTASQTAMFADETHEAALWQTSDTCGGIPFEQDWGAITALRGSGVIPADAIVVNGQSGDFITGNHISASVTTLTTNDAAERRRQIATAIIAKHHRLWRSLATPANDAVVAELLETEINEAQADLEHGAPHGIYEMLEYQDRQAKYVVSGQRTYDALGLDWRLPLWDDDYVMFWRRMPLEHKLKQNLYRRVLEKDNWGGVWENIPVNAKTITPEWIRPIRSAAKLAIAPFGKDRWHSAERRMFGWWMDPLRTSAVIPYRKALMEGRGARHAVSFIAERYLRQHGLSLAHGAAV